MQNRYLLVILASVLAFIAVESYPSDIVTATSPPTTDIRERMNYCGVNCIYFLTQYYRIPLQWDQIKKDLGGGESGATFSQLKAVLEKIGFKAHSLRLKSEDIFSERYDGTFMIVYRYRESSRLGHFFILKPRGRQLSVIDPPGPIETLDRGKFLQSMTLHKVESLPMLVIDDPSFSSACKGWVWGLAAAFFAFFCVISAATSSCVLKRAFLLFCFAYLCHSESAFGSGDFPLAAVSPKFVSKKVYFSTFAAKKERVAYTIKNVSGSTVEIADVKYSCGCSTTSRLATVLRPGQMTKLEVDVTITPGMDKPISIFLVTKQAPKIPLLLKARISANKLVMLQPTGINFGELGREGLMKKPSREFALRFDTSERQNYLSVTTISLPNRYRASWEETSRTQDAVVYRGHIQPSGVSALGSFVDVAVIFFRTGDKDYAVKLPLSYSYTEEVQTFPRELIFPHLDSGESSASLIISSKGAIRNAEIEPPIKKYRLQRISDKKIRIDLWATPALIRNHSAKLVLNGRRISVPISILEPY